MLLRKLGCLLTQAYVNWFFKNWIRHFFDFNNLIALLRPCCFNENWGFSFCKTWIVTTHYSQSCDLLIFLVDMHWHWCKDDCLHLPVFFLINIQFTSSEIAIIPIVSNAFLTKSRLHDKLRHRVSIVRIFVGNKTRNIFQQVGMQQGTEIETTVQSDEILREIDNKGPSRKISRTKNFV